MTAAALAALPMYDFSALRSAHDALWGALALELRRAGVAEVPEQLSHELAPVDAWRHPRLLFAQACEYPLAKHHGCHVRLIATPRYTAPGCSGARYRSAIVVRADDRAGSLRELEGRRCVINDRDSNSGMNLLRAAIAPHARGRPFFASVAASGAHRSSLEWLARADADVAAIDCVTLCHVMRFEPELAARVRVLAWTAATPSLPYVTAAYTDDATLAALRAALAAVCADASLEGVLGRLCIAGVDCDPDPEFAEVLRLERLALELGYPELA